MQIHRLGELRAPAHPEELRDSVLSSVDQALGVPDPLERNPVINEVPLNQGKPQRFDYGDVYGALLTLQNGRQYEKFNFIPHDQKSDVKVVGGTALGTSIYGHNTRAMLRAMRLGFQGVLIGPEGGHAALPKSASQFIQSVQNLTRISLRETAHNVHEILDVDDEKDLALPGKVIGFGESRFAGILFGVCAYAPLYEREVVFADAIAPPFPRAKPIEIKKIPESAKRLVEIGQQIGSLAIHSSEAKITELLHLHRTINPHPLFLSHMIATVPTLINGTAGKLAAEIPKDTHMHNTHFDSDPWTNIDDYLEIFKGFSLVKNDVQPGDHGDILRRDIQDGRVDRLRILRDELTAKHGHIKRVDWKSVHAGLKQPSRKSHKRAA